MKLEHYKSQLEGVSSKEEIKSVVDEAYEDKDLLESDIAQIKEYAQNLYDDISQAEFEREEAERHGENYLTDDEQGLTQM